MDISNMKNIIVLKNLPSNLVDEAIVVLKENKKVKKYQYIERKNDKNEEDNKEKLKKEENNSQYIIKEAESVVSQYITNLEMKSPKWKNNLKKLESRYKRSLQLNLILTAVAIISFLVSII